MLREQSMRWADADLVTYVTVSVKRTWMNVYFVWDKAIFQQTLSTIIYMLHFL